MLWVCRDDQVLFSPPGRMSLSVCGLFSYFGVFYANEQPVTRSQHRLGVHSFSLEVGWTFHSNTFGLWVLPFISWFYPNTECVAWWQNKKGGRSCRSNQTWTNEQFFQGFGVQIFCSAFVCARIVGEELLWEDAGTCDGNEMFTLIMMKPERGLNRKALFDFQIIVLTSDTFMPAVF